MSQRDETNDRWIARAEATGRAQARYLWLILIAGLFFAALRSRATPSTPINVPIVDLQLDAATVLASGGPILAFLILAAIGAIRAWTHAIDQIRAAHAEIPVEALDSHPNAIDLAVYTTDHSPKLLRDVLYFAYPLFLLGALLEAGWLILAGWHLLPNGTRRLFVGVVVVTWFPAAVLVLYMWGKRIERTFSKRGAA